MNAVFTQAVRYAVTARCVTPLRTGAGDTETVLRYENGKAFIQGSSLAGAMREWLEKHEPVEQQKGFGMAARLFGSRDCGGSLVVSDGVFSAGANVKLRPRIKIDGKTGAAKDQKKFDIAHIEQGETFTFCLTWLGSSSEADYAEELLSVERMLSAMNSGEILLGAQKNNGFGRLSLEEEKGEHVPAVRKTVYDLRNEQDRDAWLEDTDPYTAGEKPFRFPEQAGCPGVVFTVRGTVDSILVKSSYSEQRKKADAQGKEIYTGVTPNLTEKDRPILPGSSVKGALRSRVYGIANYLNQGKAQATVDALFGREPETSGKDNGIPGRVHCEDVTLPSGEGNRKELARVRLDRFTGGVIRQGLFWEEPVGGDLSLTVTVPADEPLACAFILYALRDLGLKLWNLGSGASIGRGFVRVREIEARTPEGKCLYLRDFYPKDPHDGDGGLLSGTWSMEDTGGVWPAWDLALEEWRGFP